MQPVNLTPDSAVLAQSEGQWQKYLMLVLFKLQGEKPIRISVNDIQAFNDTFDARGGPVLYTHGHSDAISFQIVDPAAAQRLIAHDKTQRGTA